MMQCEAVVEKLIVLVRDWTMGLIDYTELLSTLSLAKDGDRDICDVCGTECANYAVVLAYFLNLAQECNVNELREKFGLATTRVAAKHLELALRNGGYLLLISFVPTKSGACFAPDFNIGYSVEVKGWSDTTLKELTQN
jgi:hypothetical protein